jgi:hypothetical protein
MNALRKQLNIAGTPHKSIATHQIASVVLLIFKQHIGRDHAITKSALFQKLFRLPFHDDKIVDFVRWEFARRAMHLLRQRSHCFIACQSNGVEHEYYVVDSTSDAEPYIKRLETSMKNMRLMQKRALKAGEEHWGTKKTWTLPDHWLLKLRKDIKSVTKQ